MLYHVGLKKVDVSLTSQTNTTNGVQRIWKWYFTLNLSFEEQTLVWKVAVYKDGQRRTGLGCRCDVRSFDWNFDTCS